MMAAMMAASENIYLVVRDGGGFALSRHCFGISFTPVLVAVMYLYWVSGLRPDISETESRIVRWFP
jgi:hypothetical protein